MAAQGSGVWLGLFSECGYDTMMADYKVAATGGTFDIIHRGHMALLSAAFSSSERVIIGLVSDGLAKRRGKSPTNGYNERLAKLLGAIMLEFPKSDFKIVQLDDDFGPAVLEGGVDALVVSQETAYQGDTLNEQRARRGMPPVEVVVVPMSMAMDGRRISSSRIRASEIDAEGNLM